LSRVGQSRILDRSRQAAPQILEHLKNRILTLELPPNTVLSRGSLQLEYGVSQTPVRDALLQLVEEGLVDVYPQSATVVARIDLNLARQGHFLRSAVELEAVRKLALDPPEPLVPTLRTIIAEQRRLVGPAHEAFDAADRQFHRAIYEAAGIAALWATVRKHSGHIDRLRRLTLPRKGKQEAIVRDHIAITDGIRARDPVAACDALRKHVSGTLSLIDTIRQEHPDYITG
jgi:DNA-binding GntR family transcriptional regulator